MSSVLDPYQEIVRIRLSEYPDLSAERLSREPSRIASCRGFPLVLAGSPRSRFRAFRETA